MSFFSEVNSEVKKECEIRCEREAKWEAKKKRNRAVGWCEIKKIEISQKNLFSQKGGEKEEIVNFYIEKFEKPLPRHLFEKTNSWLEFKKVKVILKLEIFTS